VTRGQRLRQKVRRPHHIFSVPKGMFDFLAALARLLWMLVEPLCILCSNEQ
jgi:hypothetical protein